jgi:hypothetical protein
MAPFIVAMIVQAIFGDDMVDAKFRIVLAIGAIPAFICFVSTLKAPETAEFQSAQSKQSHSIMLKI